MTYRGQVKNGVVVLEGNPLLEEGTVVRVEPLDAGPEGAPRGSPQAILSNPARWQGDPAELDSLLAELKEMKQAEVKAQMEKWSRGEDPNPFDDE